MGDVNEKVEKEAIKKIVEILKGLSLKEAYQVLNQAQSYLTENIKIV